MPKPEHIINLTKKDERILDETWEQIAKRQGKGDVWEEWRKSKKNK